ncbi:MAG: D-2-hydroxyacid dehydrogenase [Acidobacteriota bacterium]
MTNSALKIWTNVRYDDAAMQLLRAGTAEHQLIVTEAKDAAALAEADVAFGQPDVDAVKQALRQGQLRWVHLDSAGYDRFDNDELRAALTARDAVLTNSSAVFDEPCAQHALAMMMSLARRIPQARDRQIGDHGWPMMELRAETYLLNGQTALLLGFGAIARRLVELLAPLHMNLIAVRRRPTGDEAIPVIAEDELDAHLPRADHVINLLPMSAATRHFVNAARLAVMKPGAIFYNIGRGGTVDQTALLAALESGKLAAAYLDVTDPEPLPPDHPFWTSPNCFITPHTAGGHIGERDRLVRHFLENLRRFTAGETLTDRVF